MWNLSWWNLLLRILFRIFVLFIWLVVCVFVLGFECQRVRNLWNCILRNDFRMMVFWFVCTKPWLSWQLADKKRLTHIRKVHSLLVAVRLNIFGTWLIEWRLKSNRSWHLLSSIMESTSKVIYNIYHSKHNQRWHVFHTLFTYVK